ncbi:MAG: ABC transporter ATP-binding protein [Oscillospiraceae bacterium]|nr:ABC transporter ATP-binding protein/permease [Oscillospiraceae bacterium]MDD7041156.1 ABC transporter ATP-binding protein [Oscillospiraceae bacterium]
MKIYNFALICWCIAKFLLVCAYTFFVKILSDILNLIVCNDFAAQRLLEKYLIGITLYFVLHPILMKIEKWLEGRMILELRRAHLEQFEYLDWKEFSRHSLGEYIYRISNQIQELANNKIKIISLCVEIFATAVTILYAVYLIHSAFFLIFLTVLPACVYIALKSADICLDTHEKRHLASSDFHSYMSEFANSLFEIKMAQGKKYYSEILSNALKKSYITELDHQKAVLKYQITEKITHIVVFVCFFFFSAILINNGELEIAYLITMVIYGERFFSNMLSINYLKDLHTDNLIIQKNLEGLQITKKKYNEKKVCLSSGFDVAIDFQQVKFSYDEKNFLYDFKIFKGEKIKISGRSGSGKTTLLFLITGFLQPEAGKIHLFGQDVVEASRKMFLDHISIMTQWPYLVDGSVMDNILWGTKGTKEEVLEILKKYKMLDLIYEKNGTEKIVVGYGKNLSGGEKQRISLIRTMIKPAWLYILDEPFSNLDRENTERCIRLVSNLCGEKTLIVISHGDSIDSYVERTIRFEE